MNLDKKVSFDKNRFYIYTTIPVLRIFFFALVTSTFLRIRNSLGCSFNKTHGSNGRRVQWLEVQLLRLRSDQCHWPTPVMGVQMAVTLKHMSMVILVSNEIAQRERWVFKHVFSSSKWTSFWNWVAGSNAQNGQSLKKQTWGVLWQLFGKLVRWRFMSWEMISMLSREYLQELSSRQHSVAGH